MGSNELALVYASLICNDGGVPITVDKLNAILQAVGVPSDRTWVDMYGNFFKVNDLGTLLGNVSFAGGGGGGGGDPAGAASPAAAAAETPKEAPKKEEEESLLYSILGLTTSLAKMRSSDRLFFPVNIDSGAVNGSEESLQN
jgi:ribosomal protein L12E/L44/L45/RPP1/RPP2